MIGTTRRQLIVGSVAALSAPGTPAIAADPQERVRNAVQELKDAMQERWPDAEIDTVDALDTAPRVPVICFMAFEPHWRELP